MSRKLLKDFGGPGRVRTVDLFHAMEARSQLRHRPAYRCVTLLYHTIGRATRGGNGADGLSRGGPSAPVACQIRPISSRMTTIRTTSPRPPLG